MNYDHCPCDIDGEQGITWEHCKSQHACDSCQLYVNSAYQKQEANKVKSTKKLWVAVVFANRGNGVVDSLKSHGLWESAIGNTKEEAIEKALAARDNWDSSPIDNRKYEVLVGLLTEKVVAPVKFEVVAL